MSVQQRAGHRHEFRPKPYPDGIVAQVSIADRPSFDYWALRKNGDFFLVHSLFEDTRDKTVVFFDTRIVRVVETFLFCVRLYQRLEVDTSTRVSIQIKHGGISGRALRAANPMRFVSGRNIASGSETETELALEIGEIEGQLPDLVKKVCRSLFILFDYSEFDDSIYNEIIDKFLRGQTS